MAELLACGIQAGLVSDQRADCAAERVRSGSLQHRAGDRRAKPGPDVVRPQPVLARRGKHRPVRARDSCPISALAEKGGDVLRKDELSHRATLCPVLAMQSRDVPLARLHQCAVYLSGGNAAIEVQARPVQRQNLPDAAAGAESDINEVAQVRSRLASKNPGPGLVPGMCGNKAHDRENLGIGGRRVQVSRAWSGKTLNEHKADRATVVREVLAAAGVEAPATDRMSADVLADDGLPRYVWEPVPTTEAEYATTVLLSIKQAQRWRAEYETAKQQLTDHTRAGPGTRGDGTVDSRSATTPPRPPANQPPKVA